MPKVIIDNWSQGLWTAGPTAKNPRNTATRMTNVQALDEGTVQTRSGSRRSLALASTVDGIFISGLHFYKVGTTIYNNLGVSLGFTQLGTRLRVAAMTTTGITEDMVFFPVCMKKVYQNTVSNWGINSTPQPPVATATALAGNLTGDYTYRFAFYSTVTKTLSPISAVSNTVSVISKQVTVSNIPPLSIDPQVNSVRIYRSAGGITGIWYYVDKVTLGTLTYTDNVADVGLGDPVDTTMIAPLTCNVASKYKNRMLLLDVNSAPRMVYPSAPSTPETFSAIVFELLMEAGDTAEAVIEMGDYAMVIGRRGIYAVQVDNNGIIYTARVVSGKGTVNGRTIAMGDLGIYFTSDDGVFIISGMNIYKMSDNIDSLFRDVNRGGLSTIADYNLMSASFIGGRYYLHYYGTDNQWHMVSYNERKQRWRHFTGWRYTVAATEGALPMVGLPNAVGINDWDENTDDGTPFYSEVGFNIPTAVTALLAIRTFRLSLQCEGIATVAFYDGDDLKYSLTLTGYTYDDAYQKHSLPVGTYFLQPEVRVSCSDKPFTLKMFEASVDYVRKYEADYTRSLGGVSNGAAAGNTTQAG